MAIVRHGSDHHSPCSRSVRVLCQKRWIFIDKVQQTNLRDIDVITMDTDTVAEYIKAHGANTWLQSIGGIIANYQSKLDFHYINPMLREREGGDLVKDTIESAHARGIRVLGRMDFSKVHRKIADANPQWAYVSPNGTWQTHPRGLVSVCPSTEWYQNRTFDIIEEIIDNYDVEGFFVNYAGYNENDYFRNVSSANSHWDASLIADSTGEFVTVIAASISGPNIRLGRTFPRVARTRITPNGSFSATAF